MEQDRSQETQSAYDSQDVSSSQQESTVSEGHSAGDEANSTSSLHDTEAINSAIMEVSGELVQGLFSPQKHLSGGSDSSDISDDDNGQGRSLGAIARYPESSTGLSDNDWNPYATESDTNQTPRSPRSNASDDNRVGYISKASINVVAPSDKQKDVVATVSMTTGKMTVGSSGTDREVKASRNGGERLDILKYMIDSDVKPDKTGVDAGKHNKQELIYSRLKANGDEGERRDSADSGRSVNSNESRHSHTETETIKSSGSQDNRRESGGTVRSVNTDGTRSTRDSFESAQSELERTTEAAKSARQSVDSQNSVRSEGSQASEASRKSEKSSGRASDRSERLDKLSSATDENIKELIQFETAQRVTNTRGENDEREDVSRTRLSAKVESYRPTARNSGHEDRSKNALGRTGYVSVAERQLLLSESPDHTEFAGEAERHQQAAQSAREPIYKVPDMFMDRSPSEISMRRVSNLFEETKKQVRQAVSVPRPDPSGSEERFPLKERLTWNPHDDSLMAHEMLNKKSTRRGEDQKEKSTQNLRDSEVARSLTSEEVARVLGRYSELEENGIATSTPINNFSDQPAQLMSAFDKIGQTQSGGYDDRRGDTADVSDDEIARKVQAILARSEELGVGRSRQRQTESQLDREEYASQRIDYRRLERDLEEIQGSLPEVPRSKANDSMPMLSQGRSGATSAASEVYRSLESTGTANLGRESAMSEFNTRESGASEYGRRLAWDHGADLEYDPTYGGQFLGTMTSTETDTLSQRLRRLGADPDNLIVRPDSTTTNDTDNDAAEFETLGTKTLTGSDISRAEKLVEQVMNRHAEGDLKESVEDIIARYRNERKDLFERFQHDDQREQDDEKEHLNPDSNHVSPTNDKEPTQKPLLKPVNGTHDGSGLAERVYKILTSHQKGITEPELVEKGMAQEVCRILTQERPHHQVNGILSEAMAEEHKMLKKLVTRPKDDSSMDDSGVNESEVSFATDDRAVRKQLEYSAMSSPEKADLTDIRHVTAAPYTAVSNAKSLLSSQLKKMSERNFDKTVELRTPYRQVIDCYPVYGVEKSREPEQQAAGREAWMPRPRDDIRASDKDKALSNERFFLTDRDRLRGSQDPSSTDNHRTRTRSDPFDLSPGRSRNGHVRSRSEEAASDLGHHTAFGHHTADPELSYTDRRTASSPWSFTGPRKKDGDWSTPTKHIPKDWSCECYSSLSDSSSLRNHSDSTCSSSDWQHNHGSLTSFRPLCKGHYSGHLSRGQSAFAPFDRKNKSLAKKLKKKTISLEEQLDKRRSPLKQLLNNTVIQTAHNGALATERSGKHKGQDRGRERFRKAHVKRVQIQEPVTDLLCSSLPAYYPGRGYVEPVPFTRDDVYELLGRSLAQEQKLAEIQSKIYGQPVSPACKGSGWSHSAMNCYAANGQLLQGASNYDVIQEGSLSESETSSSRKGSRLRPYRPMGSRDVYYTESGDDTNESGATVESTHAGSDDAVPPYFPRQILGSRQSPQQSPEGQDQQHQGLDEHTARKGNSGEVTSRLTRQDLGEGKQGRTSDPTSPRRESGLDTGYQSRTTDRDMKLGTEPVSQLERPGFRTREEFERDFAQRERELRAEMQRRLSERRLEQQLGASTRSDPGGMFEDGGWEYSEADDSQGFRLMEPEPAYPRERLRCSRSKSDTNLMDISPNDSQKYSSPMQPGTRFLELSTQPSPIFGHHDSLTISARRGPGQGSNPPPELPRVPVEREKGYGEDKRRSRSPIHEPVRPLEPGEPPLRSADLEKPRPLEPVPRPLEPGSCPLEIVPAPGQEDCMGPVDLGADPRSIPLELRRGPSCPLRSRSPVSQHSRSRSPSERRSKSPLQIRQKEMERQLEALNQQLNNQVKEIQQEDKQTDEHFEDQFPPSKKAQVLREVLEQEYNDKLPPNINDMWSRFQATRDQSVTESSLNSTRLDALSGLLQNPTSHTANSFIKAKHEERQQQQRKVIMAEGDMTSGKDGQKAREKTQQDLLNEKEKLERDLRDFEKKAAEERSLRRQELRQRHGLSEEESNGSYQEILMEKSRRKEKRRTGDKGREREGVREGERKERKKKSPEKIKADLKARDEKENEKRNVEKGVSTDIKYRSSNKSITTRPQHNDSVDTLFSIPEDASFEQSPSKAESEMRSKQRRHRHVIDPLMSKLRDKITLQRVKIDKERRKELQRVEKLKKLEMLLKAKTKGKLSDKAIDVELQNVSSTTSVSPSEQSSNLFSDSTVMSAGMESDASSGISTTMKDTTVDTLKLQVKKYPVEKFSSPKKTFVDLSTDSAASSDFSNIVVERLPKMMDKPKESRSSKGKKVRVDEFGNKIRKEKKEKKNKKRKDEYNTAELMGEVIRTGLEREQYQSPQRRQGSPDRGNRSTGRHSSPGPRLSPDRYKRLMQDACTMYPSPITVSPPSRRRLREVLMKSEAIQTSPSVRSTSPSYSYDEVPVAPVPLMSQMSTSKTSRCRPSSTSPTPSKSRSSQTSRTSSHKLSKSPSNSARSPVTFRKGSRSPIGRSSRKSSSSPLRHNMPQKTVNNPMWKPESQTTPPNNSMFTPEDENTLPLKDRQEQATSWFIPLKTDKPWRQPLKERQAFSVRQETWQPTSVSQSTWKDIVHGQVLIDKGDPNDVSRDTKFDLDPDGQPIRDEETPTDSDEEDEDVKSRHLGKMTLQEAFQVHKQIVISRLRERQKRLNLAADQRKMDAFLKQERDKLFHEERRKEANPEAHPYSDNLYRPTRRTISKDEMKEMAFKKYKKLPEVVEQEKLKKRQEEYSLNRLKARLFNRKMQRKVLQKADKWGR